MPPEFLAVQEELEKIKLDGCKLQTAEMNVCPKKMKIDDAIQLYPCIDDSFIIDKDVFLQFVQQGKIPLYVFEVLVNAYGPWPSFINEPFFAVPLVWANKHGKAVQKFGRIHFLLNGDGQRQQLLFQNLSQVLFVHFKKALTASRQRKSREDAKIFQSQFVLSDSDFKNVSAGYGDVLDTFEKVLAFILNNVPHCYDVDSLGDVLCFAVGLFNNLVVNTPHSTLQVPTMSVMTHT